MIQAMAQLRNRFAFFPPSLSQYKVRALGSCRFAVNSRLAYRVVQVASKGCSSCSYKTYFVPSDRTDSRFNWHSFFFLFRTCLAFLTESSIFCSRRHFLSHRPRSRSPRDRSSRSRSRGRKASRSPSPRDRSPRDRSPRDRSPRDRSPRDKSPRDRSPRDRSPRDRSPMDRSPRDRSPRDRSPRDRSPRDRSPRDRSPSPRQRSSRSPSPLDRTNGTSNGENGDRSRDEDRD